MAFGWKALAGLRGQLGRFCGYGMGADRARQDGMEGPASWPVLVGCLAAAGGAD